MTDHINCTCPSLAGAIFGQVDENTCELHAQPPTQKDYVSLNDAEGLAGLLGIPTDNIRENIHNALTGHHDV